MVVMAADINLLLCDRFENAPVNSVRVFGARALSAVVVIGVHIHYIRHTQSCGLDIIRSLRIGASGSDHRSPHLCTWRIN